MSAPTLGAREHVADGEILTDSEGHAFSLRPIRCPTCGIDETRTLGMRGGPHHRWGLGIPTQIVRCRRCSLIYPNPFPYPVDPQELYSDPESYFARHEGAARLAEYRELVRRLIDACQTNRPSLLDVGSGRGDLLHAARLEGLNDLVGLEFADAMVSYARDHHGVELLPLTIEQYAESHPRTFDGVVLNAIIEHVYDPDSFVASVARLTRPGSVLYVDTPREPHLLTWVGNAWSRLTRNDAVYNLSPTWPPYHVFGFSPKALRILLGKHGFAVERVRVHSDPSIPARPELGDRLRAFAGVQLNRVANLTHTASNMYVWARRV